MSVEKQQYLQREEQTMNKAIDLSHHLSDLANARQISPLKGLQKFIKPDAIQFAGGELPLRIVLCVPLRVRLKRCWRRLRVSHARARCAGW